MTDSEVLEWLEANYHDEWMLVPPNKDLPPDTGDGSENGWGLYQVATLWGYGRTIKEAVEMTVRRLAALVSGADQFLKGKES